MKTILKLIWLMCQIIALKTVLFFKKRQGDIIFSFVVIAVFSSLAIPNENSTKGNEIKLDSFYVEGKITYKQDYWERILPKSEDFTNTLDSLQKEFGVLVPDWVILYQDSIDTLGRIVYTDEFGVGRLIVNDPTIVNPHWEIIRYVTDVVVNDITSGSVKLSDVIKDPRALRYLSRNEMIRRAVVSSKRIGTYPSVMLAQAALESGYGKSSLTKLTKNEGNIKCSCNHSRALRAKHAVANPQVCYRKRDLAEGSNDYYKIFQTSWEGWQDRVRVWNRFPEVKEARENKYNQYQWCVAIHKSKYATDPVYDKSLWNIIQRDGLLQLDSCIQKNISLISDNGQYTYYP